MKYLVVGSDSCVGSYLMNYYEKGDVVGTSRRKVEKTEGNILYYDLQTSDLTDFSDPFVLSRQKTAIICAAVSSTEKCCVDYERAYMVNVTYTVSLIKQLSDWGYYIVFLSSDAVFDGNGGNYREIDLTNPINCYGKMKEKVEEIIKQNYFDNVCVLRLSKVIGCVDNGRDLLVNWKDRALRKEKIKCIQGNVLTPVFVGDIARNVTLLAMNHITGIVHLGGPMMYERKKLCQLFLESIGLDTTITECDVSEIGLVDGFPINTSLCTNKLKELGGNLTCIEDIFSLYR